jgi:hypothetical protein
MNEKWGLYPTSSTNGDSGILKKITKPETDNNLLVFGYSCKIFRDDAKAQFIDQGKHLIKHPLCPGDDIKIDRLVELVYFPFHLIFTLILNEENQNLNFNFFQHNFLVFNFKSNKNEIIKMLFVSHLCTLKKSIWFNKFFLEKRIICHSKNQKTQIFTDFYI